MSTLVSWLPDLLEGLRHSLWLTFVSLLLGLPLGLVLGYVAELTPSRPVRWLLVALIELARGLPALVVLYLVYYGLPSVSIVLSSFWSVILAFTVSNAGYVSEIVRGALRGIPAGQLEACRALGIGRTRTFLSVIAPQALRISTPSLISYAAIVFQSTSLAVAVAEPELLSAAYNIGSITFEYVQVFVLAGALYAVVVVAASRLAGWLSARTAY
ncbi:amino acid ABC transporter permease [Nocardioides sp. GY 10127]|uniref:amino acid ABC transporter permease n=1 Tax=Nocardioides sp. GY 10127 TaxID=2569762 RepID=UPI0010A7C97C|nr:amino acid ABC transporter permease [Nocardioides sp. GY 10127]TIC85638.1 amino acid ABC transporter permease [Nocardioides sp. GY 10127]